MISFVARSGAPVLLAGLAFLTLALVWEIL
jgi:hypothetical protein